MQRARIHRAAGHLPAAITCWRAILTHDPSRLDAHLELAEALASGGWRDEAIDSLIDAGHTMALDARFEAAVKLYSKAFVLDPDRAEPYFGIACIERWTGRPDAARTRMERLATTYMEQGRVDEAAQIVRLTTSWDEDDAGVPAATPANPRPERTVTEHTVVVSNPLLPGPVPPPSPPHEVLVLDSDELVVLDETDPPPDGAPVHTLVFDDDSHAVALDAARRTETLVFEPATAPVGRPTPRPPHGRSPTVPRHPRDEEITVRFDRRTRSVPPQPARARTG